MSRPKPTILAELTNKQNFKNDQILESEAIWAVFFQEKPFNLKSCYTFTDKTDAKYKKTSFSNKGHAINLCKKLNKLFNTDQFSVFKLTTGEKIE